MVRPNQVCQGSEATARAVRPSAYRRAREGLARHRRQAIPPASCLPLLPDCLQSRCRVVVREAEAFEQVTGAARLRQRENVVVGRKARRW